MISDELASVADKLAGFGLRGCSMEPEVAAAIAVALLDCAAQVAALEIMPFVIAAEVPHVQQ